MRKNGAFYQNLKMCTFLLIFVYNNTSNVKLYRLRVLLRENFRAIYKSNKGEIVKSLRLVRTMGECMYLGLLEA